MRGALRYHYSMRTSLCVPDVAWEPRGADVWGGRRHSAVIAGVAGPGVEVLAVTPDAMWRAFVAARTPLQWARWLQRHGPLHDPGDGGHLVPLRWYGRLQAWHRAVRDCAWHARGAFGVTQSARAAADAVAVVMGGPWSGHRDTLGRYVALAITRWIEAAPPSVAVLHDETDGRFRPLLVAARTWHALGVGLLAACNAAPGGGGLCAAPGCDRFATSARAKFCATCRDKGAPNRLRVQRHRARQRGEG